MYVTTSHAGRRNLHASDSKITASNPAQPLRRNICPQCAMEGERGLGESETWTNTYGTGGARGTEDRTESKRM